MRIFAFGIAIEWIAPCVRTLVWLQAYPGYSFFMLQRSQSFINHRQLQFVTRQLGYQKPMLDVNLCKPEEKGSEVLPRGRDGIKRA